MADADDGPDAPPLTLDGLHGDLLQRIIDVCSGRDAARLAIVSKMLKDAVMASRWPPWSPEPHILADGTVCEPLSGRYNAVVHPRDGWARLRQAVNAVPEDGTLLVMPGMFEATGTIVLNRPIYIFGRGVTIKGKETRKFVDAVPLFSCTASRGALVGIFASAHVSSESCVVSVTSGFRLQGCTLSASDTCNGVNARGHAARPVIAETQLLGCNIGVRLWDGAVGTVYKCSLRNCFTGILVQDSGDRSGLWIEANAIACRGQGIHIAIDVDRGFTLGPGNTIRGGFQDVFDRRRRVADQRDYA